MRARNYVIGGLCSAVIVAQGASTPGGSDPAIGDDGLDVVPAETLKDMRGGVDLNGLVGYFAIDRVVEVDGQVVAKMQIVVSNLDKLSTGGMPTISITGPLAQLVQVMNGPAGSGGAPPVVVAAASTSPEPRSTEASRGGAGAAGSAGVAASGSAVGSSGAAGAAGVTGQAVGTAAAGAAGGASGGSGTGGAGSVSAPIQSTVQIVPGAPGAAPSVAPAGQPAQANNNAAENITKIIPIGNTGQFVVVSNLPNAGAIATAVQNEVRGTLIQTQTTITAQLNSLTLLNAMQLANAMRLQLSLPH